MYLAFLLPFSLLALVGCPTSKDTETGGPIDTTDDDGDGWSASSDCDDSDSTVNPGALEICDGVDNDCDEAVDEDVISTWYADADGDGYGDTTLTTTACEKPAGYVPTGTDCDDGNPSIFPGASEVCDGLDGDCDGLVDDGVLLPFFADGDGDGFGDPAVPVEACALPSGASADASDCDDADPTVNPDAVEVCDGRDDDCDGDVDEGVEQTYYADLDGDGSGDPGAAVNACSPPTGTVSDGTDCDDTDPATHPAAPEVCDGKDNDCDGDVDDGILQPYYQDADADGWGDATVRTEACREAFGWSATSGDCDDFDDAIHPAATEVCDGKDNDCDGVTDEADAADAATWYRDADGDGHGDPAIADLACTPGAGWVTPGDDCEDGDAHVYPGAWEVCDGLDDDCDGEVDEGDALDPATWYADTDGDGYGDAGSTAEGCTAPTGFVRDDADCDDTDAAIHPAADETCNGRDDDCDGTTDEPDAVDAPTWYADADADGYGDAATSIRACTTPSGYGVDATDCDDTAAAVHPGAAETCNGVDDDCDGTTDEPDAVDAPTWYADADGDGYGDAATPTRACTTPSGYGVDATDCDDDDPDARPGAEERCDGHDDDCDGTTDEPDAVDAPTWYADADGDGYGDAATPTRACTAPSGFGADATDCDDADGSVHPGASEACNGVDDDCDGTTDWSITALHFVESDDAVAIADDGWLDFGTTGTIEAWVYPEGGSGMVYNKWVDGLEDKWLWASPSGAGGGHYYGPGLYMSTSATAVLADAWNHLAFVLDTSSTRLYVNGVLAGAGPGGADVWDSVGDAFIGGIYRDGYQHPPMVGFIAEVRLSSTARYTGDFVPEVDLAADGSTNALWRLDEEAGSTAWDASGHGLDGVISGATWDPVGCVEE